MARKVLVVDDESSICELIKLALSGKGFDVITASTGEEGVKLVKESSPDLVLLDMTMPDISGTEAARKMKETEPGKNVPIIIMSGRGTTESELDRSLFAGILNKPFSIADLIKTANTYTSKTSVVR